MWNGKRLAHFPDEVDHLRDDIEHHEQHDADYDGTYKRRIDDDGLRLADKLVLPFQGLRQFEQDVGQLTGFFSDRNEIDEHVVENVGKFCHRL